MISVKIGYLRLSPRNRYTGNDDELTLPAAEPDDDLTSSMRYLGLLTPLAVIGPDEHGYYEILSGERRYSAYIKDYRDRSKVYVRCSL